MAPLQYSVLLLVGALLAPPLHAQYSAAPPPTFTAESVDTAALARYERAHAARPRDYPRAYALALVYAQLDRHADVLRVLRPFAGRTVTNSTFYEVLAEAELGSGDAGAAEETVKAGLKHYPYARDLQRMQAEFERRRGRYQTTQEIFASELPKATALELAGLIGFEENDVVNGLLYAETAALEDADRDFASIGRLSPKLAAAVRRAYRQLLDSAAALKVYPAGSFESAYADALRSASNTMRGLGTTYASEVEAFADLRVATLRLFAERGNLTRYRHPLLDDVFVLETRGYLRWVTLAALRAIDPEPFTTQATLRTVYAQEVDQYLQTTWGRDIDAYLGALGEPKAN